MSKPLNSQMPTKIKNLMGTKLTRQEIEKEQQKAEAIKFQKELKEKVLKEGKTIKK
jgi:ribosomal protein L14E/L6E/L27E